MSPSDSLHCLSPVMSSRGKSRLAPLPVQGLPGFSTDLSTRAVPNHPGRSAGCNYLLPSVSGFTLVGRLAIPSSLTRPNRVHLPYSSRVRRHRSPAPLLEPTPLWLHVEQAIYMVNSFQFTRSARLILAYRPSGSGNEVCEEDVMVFAKR